MCWWGGRKHSVEWISCRCFYYYLFYLCIHEEYNVINGTVGRKLKRRFRFQFYKKHYKVCYWVVMGGSGRGDLKEMSFMVVLLGGGNSRMVDLLWIIIFDFYMILCSGQIIYLNDYSVVKLCFDRGASILHNWNISTC